jgi:hypothetical protein
MNDETNNDTPTSPAGTPARDIALNPNAYHRRADGKIRKRWPPPPEGWEDIYFNEMAEHGVKTWAMAAAGIANHRTVNNLIKNNPDFAQRTLDAQEKLRDKLRKTITDRVFDGTWEEVYQRGELVGYKRIIDNKLLMWFAERAIPEEFHLASSSGVVDHTIKFEFKLGEAPDTIDAEPEDAEWDETND